MWVRDHNANSNLLKTPNVLQYYMFLLFLNVAVTVIYYNKCSVNKTIQQPVDVVKTYLKPAE